MPLQQDIRFCTSSDGVRIASASSGSGPPLVRAGTWLSHLECDAREGDTVAGIEALGRHHTFVRYDSRGCGLSDRNIAPFSFDDLVADLEAVVDARGLQRFALLGISMGAAIAVAYAARHPDRVSHLVVLNGFASSYFSTRVPNAAARAEAELLLKNAEIGWSSATSTFRHVFTAQLMASPGPEHQRAMEERMRLSMTPEMAVAYLKNNYAINVREQCRRVQCPALVFHSRLDRMITAEQGRGLAALIPGARLVTLESQGHILLFDEPAARMFYDGVSAFLGDGRKAAAPFKLTPRQAQVLRAVADGLTDKQVARQLSLSPRTVEMHVAGALKALGCATRAEAVFRATDARLLAD